MIGRILRGITRLACTAALLGTAAAGSAQTLQVEVTLPRFEVSEYHRPYVAIWVEDTRRVQVEQIALLLEQEKWHRDLRSWWRRGGSALQLPIDGVSGATRKPGTYRFARPLTLPPGRYTLNVEAVREVGGREHLQLPFDWNGQALAVETAGSRELGAVVLRITEVNP